MDVKTALFGCYVQQLSDALVKELEEARLMDIMGELLQCSVSSAVLRVGEVGAGCTCFSTRQLLQSVTGVSLLRAATLSSYGA